MLKTPICLNMDSWDETVSKKPNTLVTNQWEGEDEESDVQDSWDQESKESIKEEVTVKNISVLKRNRIEAKDKKTKRNLETESLEDPKHELTPEEKIAEKLRQQKLQEESDLNLAKEICGVSSLDSKEEFDHLKDQILKKLSECPKNAHFVYFAEQIIQTLCLHLSSTDLKKVHSLIGKLHIEKLKMEKGEKSKNKLKIRAKLKVENETDYDEYSAFTEDCSDFI